jgi:spore coat protein CotH
VVAACLGLATRVAAQESVVVPDPSEAFFDDSVVQELQLRIHSADWQKLQETYLENTYYPCDLVWRGQTVYNVGIRSRGSGSRNRQKPGLRVDFDRYSTDQAFLGLKSFVLDNLTQDPSGLRERLTMKFLQRMGFPAPREAHVRLYVNNVYIGVYALVEAIDKRFMKRIEGLDPDGFLFEYKWKDTWVFSVRGSSYEAYQAIFSPQTHEKDAASVLYPPIESFVRLVNTSTNLLADIGSYLDPREFLSYLAVELFLAEWDGLTGYAGMNNFYLYKRPQKHEFRFLAWDKDNTFHAVDYPILQGTGDNVLARRLLEIPELREHLLNRMLECVAAADTREGEAAGDLLPPTWLEGEVARQAALVRQAMLEDTFKPFSNEEFEAAIIILQTFARERGPFVSAEVQRLAQ